MYSLFSYLYLCGILYRYAITDAAIFTVFPVRKAFTIEAKSKEFVEEIKEELTNNNDDYLESSPLVRSTPHARVAWHQHRRASLISEAPATSTTNSPFSTSISPTKVELSPSVVSPKTVDPGASSCSLEVNNINSKEKTEANDGDKGDISVRGAMNENSPEDLRRNSLVFSREVTIAHDSTVDIATTLKLVTGKKSRKPHKAHKPHKLLKAREPTKSKGKDILKSLLRDPDISGKHGAPTPNFRAAADSRHHQRPLARADLALSRERPPDSRQLDMAPAQGARVESMRYKNRLCQRNVLIPEGPKYDSQGRVYLAAYTPRAPTADYARTRPHRLVLPRCCNCCKKSVLGCE